MRKVFLVTGFNNWGKTTLLSQLFSTKAFRKRVPQYYANCPFLVMPKSNDDLGKDRYEEDFNERLEKYEETNGKAKYIASAFCPTKEPINDSIAILRTLFKKDQIEILLLEHKWCGHAKLQIPEISAFYSGESNVTIHAVKSKNPAGKLVEAQAIFTSKLP
jgi:Zn ribbon nucleic-acid-binding protein